MQTAHCNLINIERTSEEIKSAFAQTETLKIIPIETEDSRKDLLEIKETRKFTKGHTSSNPTFRILINNIAGVNKYHRKLESIIQEREIDLFLGQEINIQTRDKRFQNFKRTKNIRKYHFVTSETEGKSRSQKKPGGTFCITTPRLKLRVIQRLVDYMGRWAGCVYQIKGLYTFMK